MKFNEHKTRFELKWNVDISINKSNSPIESIK